MESLDALIENLDAQRVTLREAFSPADGDGFRRMSHRDPVLRESNELRLLQLMADVRKGKKPSYYLQEVMSTSDFPNLMGGTLERVLLGGFAAWPSVFENFFGKRTVGDFREHNGYYIDGGEGELEQVDENAPYPETSLSEREVGIRVYKYGKVMPFSWEMVVNDDLNAFTTIPLRFGRAAARTRSKFATRIYADANGPHADLFDANNTVTSNPALSIAALGTAMAQMATATDSDGEPIMINLAHLVVPPALEMTASNILNATELWLNEAGGTSNQQMHVANWMRNRVRLHVDPYLPSIITSTTTTIRGNTSWFLFADPGTAEPAVEFATLRGHETPEVFLKAPNAMRVGGGLLGPMEGDFEYDNIRYKVRDVFGFRRGTEGSRTVIGSNGTGS